MHQERTVAERAFMRARRNHVSKPRIAPAAKRSRGIADAIGNPARIARSSREDAEEEHPFRQEEPACAFARLRPGRSFIIHLLSVRRDGIRLLAGRRSHDHDRRRSGMRVRHLG